MLEEESVWQFPERQMLPYLLKPEVHLGFPEADMTSSRKLRVLFPERHHNFQELDQLLLV